MFLSLGSMDEDDAVDSGSEAALDAELRSQMENNREAAEACTHKKRKRQEHTDAARARLVRARIDGPARAPFCET
jgi:hypothetical protein